MIGVLIGHVGEDMPLIVEFGVESRFDPFCSLAVEDHRLDAVKRHRRSDIVPRDVECGGVEHDVIVEEREFYPDLILEGRFRRADAVLGVLGIEVRKIAFRHPDIRRHPGKELVKRADVPADRRVVARVGHASDQRQTVCAKAAGNGDQRRERGVEPILSDARAHLQLAEVDLVGRVKTIVVRAQSVVVAGMLRVAEEFQAKQRRLRRNRIESVGNVGKIRS